MTTQLDKLLSSGCSSDGATKVCRSRGGESCAFDGAMIVLQPIADAVHIVHGPASCLLNTWEGRSVHSSAGDLHTRGFGTAMSELDIVYGAGEKLAVAIDEAVERCTPAAVFVHATCVSGLTGEDIDAVATAAQERLGVPVVPVHGAGFVGPKNLGNRIAGEALLEHVIGTAEPDFTTPTDLVLIGEYNVAGDLDLVEPLFEEAGIRLLSRITGNAGFEEIRYAHRARAAAVVCSRALINVASELNSRYGIPAVEVSFFGATETAAGLRRIAALLEDVSPDAAGLADRAEAIVTEREAWLAEALVPYASLRGKRAVLYSGGVKSWSMVSALRDLGIDVVAVGAKKATQEDEEKIRATAPEVPVHEDVGPAVIRRLMAEHDADMLVAGGRNQYLAAKEGWPFVDVNQERHSAYAGYEGLVNLARDLHHSIEFYDREHSARGAAPAETLTERRSSLSLDPIGGSATFGAVLALQGVEGAVPLLHGAQGCSFLEKVMGVKAFREPFALATTNLFAEEVVMGADEALKRGIDKVVGGSEPELVGVIPTSVSEVKGDDISAALREYGAPAATELVHIGASDYSGTTEEGFASAVSALVGLAEPGEIDTGQITVLVGSHLTPADAMWLKDTIAEFGLFPICVPDLSALDGSRRGLSPLAEGGVLVDELRQVGRSVHTLVVGPSLEGVACELRDRFGTPYTVLDTVAGRTGSAQMLSTLSLLSGNRPSGRQDRYRRQLVDAMRDAHLVFAGASIALALEADHALQAAAVLYELCARHVVVVVPRITEAARRIPAAEVICGDLADVPLEIELLIGDARARRTAERAGAAFLELGVPAYRRFGASHELRIGYRGTTHLVDRVAELLSGRRHGLDGHNAQKRGQNSETPDIRGGQR